MFTNLLYPNKQKVLFLTAVGHPPHIIMFSGNFLCFTSVSEESVLAETSATKQSTHEAPEVAIGIIFASLKFHEAFDPDKRV